MSVHVNRDKVFFAFAPDISPVAEVEQGQELLIQTHDCFEGQLRSETDLVTALDWNHVNPATGPIYIKEARPGDVLRVDLLDVQVTGQATMVAIPGEGALGARITEMETAILPVRDGQVHFKDRVSIPVRPMIGVIGVAPGSGRVPTGTPGPHGGNMDCTLIGAGASVYFTVGVAGALLGCGDLHAVMGDGEIVVCGAEVPGEVRLRAEVVNLPGLPTPFVATADLVATIYSAETLDEATQGAVDRMAHFLTECVGLPLNDAGMLMSLVGALKYCQVVDPAKTVRFEFPRSVLASYGYNL